MTPNETPVFSSPRITWGTLSPSGEFRYGGQAVLTGGHVGCAAPGNCGNGVWPRLYGAAADAQWIWKTQNVSPDEARMGDTIAFRGSVCGTNVRLLITADNAYKVYLLDGDGKRSAEPWFQDGNWQTIEEHWIGNPCQEYEIHVTNYGVPGSTPWGNPAGLLFAFVSYPDEP
jgi:hypothetical protein